MEEDNLKRSFFNRILSLLLALVCILGVLPPPAFAAEGLPSTPNSITQKDCDYMYSGGKPVKN